MKQTYRVGKGEQGVFRFVPYKSELLPLWRFRTPALAKESSAALMKKFKSYKESGDFSGMDMTRKYLQMGYTRSRRYANHRSGKKYLGPVPADKKGISGSHGRPLLPRRPDLEKAKSAEIFRKAWRQVESDPVYRRLKSEWKIKFG